MANVVTPPTDILQMAISCPKLYLYTVYLYIVLYVYLFICKTTLYRYLCIYLFIYVQYLVLVRLVGHEVFALVHF